MGCCTKYSNANGSFGLFLAIVALAVVLIYGCLAFAEAVLAADSIDIRTRRPDKLRYVNLLQNYAGPSYWGVSTCAPPPHASLRP